MRPGITAGAARAPRGPRRHAPPGARPGRTAARGHRETARRCSEVRIDHGVDADASARARLARRRGFLASGAAEPLPRDDAPSLERRHGVRSLRWRRTPPSRRGVRSLRGCLAVEPLAAAGTARPADGLRGLSRLLSSSKSLVSAPVAAPRHDARKTRSAHLSSGAQQKRAPGLRTVRNQDARARKALSHVGAQQSSSGLRRLQDAMPERR